ncbi:MAG: glutamate--tRNA ligase [Chloroflexota bacterium]
MSKPMKPVRVRFAPSPTGRTHLGSGRTALYNFLLARQTGGQFILRIEDTDQKRYVPGAEDELMESLRWLGLDWDEGPDVGGPHAPYRQSERKEIYQQYAQQLIEGGYAYYCFCPPEPPMQERRKKGKHPTRQKCPCRNVDAGEAGRRVAASESHVIRFKMPAEGSITVTDALRGEITVENKTLDDYILVKSDGLPVYHLAVVIDDHLMGITHVFRTSEWLPTFPLHGHIYTAFGWEQPVWVHPSIFLKPSGKGKMSKRDFTELMKDGKSIFLSDFKELGYLPEAVVNWAALMGWSYDDHTEFFTMDDLIEKFSIEKLNPSPAAINFSKLDHFNGLHIRNLELDELAARIKPFFEKAGYCVDDDKLREIAPLLQVRLATLGEAPEKAGFFFEDEVHPIPEELIGKKMSAADSANAARGAYEVLVALPEISHVTAEGPMRTLADELGLKAGQLFGIIRVAVTGQRVSPPLFESMSIVGREKVLQRILNAIRTLEELGIGDWGLEIGD